MDADKKFYLNLIKLVLIALFLRFLIMPFSFHGHDIFWMNYFPFKFIEDKVYDPYLYIEENLPNMKSVYYPPVAFYILGFFQFLFKAFLPQLKELYSIFASWDFAWEGNTIHFADILTDHQLFRTLFFLKIPYLICDFVTGFVLFQLLKKDKKKVFIALTIWALNPFMLHSVYALGQLDIILAMFIMLSLLAVRANRPYIAIVCMTLAAGVKIIPLLLIPPLVIVLGKNPKEQVKLALISVLFFLVPFAPFYLTSKFAALNIFGFNLGISILKRDAFIAAYLLFLAVLYFFRKKDIDIAELLMLSFITILLLFYSIYDVTLRYFIWVTPLLILLAVRNRIFWVYNVIFLITLFELRAAGNSQQWGLLAALHPEFFSSLPIADSYLNLAVNVKYIHQLMYRLFFASSLVMVAHIFVVNKNLFELPFSGLRKR